MFGTKIFVTKSSTREQAIDTRMFLPFFCADENSVENSDGKTPVDDVRPVVELLPLVFRLIDGRIVGDRQLLEKVLQKSNQIFKKDFKM